MTTSSLPHVYRLAQFLCDAGFKAQAWQNRRVYINAGPQGQKLGRDIKCYIELDEPLAPAPEGEPDAEGYHPLFAGCALKVYTNAEQDPAWIGNRRKQTMHDVAGWLHGVGLIGRPCEDWREVLL